MARFNELQVGRYNRYFQKILSMKGPATVVTIADELIPVLNIQAKSEDLFMQSWESYKLADSVANVAAQQSVYSLRNPIGSNVVAVITRMNLQFITAADVALVRYQAGNAQPLTGGTAGVAAQNLDARSQRSASTLINAFLNSAAPPLLGQPIFQVAAPIATYPPLEFCVNTPEDEIPLLPGSIIEILSAGVNQTMRVGFHWRERFLEDSERS